MQERPFLNPCWFSSKIASVFVCRRVFNTYVYILYPAFRRLMPLYLRHKFCFPFLNSKITWASYQVLGILTNCQHLLMKFRSVLLRCSPLYLNSSALIPSGPVAFLFLIFLVNSVILPL
jgi:hypothetical protein